MCGMCGCCCCCSEADAFAAAAAAAIAAAAEAEAVDKTAPLAGEDAGIRRMDGRGGNIMGMNMLGGMPAAAAACVATGRRDDGPAWAAPADRAGSARPPSSA